jgi:hypothetical protein
LLSCEAVSSVWSCDVLCEGVVDTVGWKKRRNSC